MGHIPASCTAPARLARSTRAQRPAGGCHSSNLFPSGSTAQPNRPYGVSPTSSITSTPPERSWASIASSVLMIDLAVRDWARRDPAVAERLRRIDNRRMFFLRSLFGTFCADPDDVEARCMLFFSLLIGNHSIAADHGTRSRADVLALTLRQLGASVLIR